MQFRGTESWAFASAWSVEALTELRFFRVCVALAALILSPAASSDWVNLSGAENAPNIAEITISDQRVDVELEVYINDLRLLETPSGIGLSVRADGVELKPRVILREQRVRKDRYSPFAGIVDPRTRRQIPGPPADTRVIFLAIAYELPPRPERITFTPPLDQQGAVAATIGFLVYHKSAPLIDFRYLSQPETLVLDWDDPWYSAFENRNLTRHHKWPQMSFLYIEPREVRHELLLRVRDLAHWTGQQLSPDSKMSEEEKLRLKQAAIDFCAKRNPLRIDETLASPSAVRAEFLNISPTGLQVVEQGGPVDASSAILGISQSFWTPHLPDSVTVEWELFDDRADQVPTNVTDPAGPFPGFVTREFPTIEWQNFLKNFEEPLARPVRTDEGRLLDWPAIRFEILGTPDSDAAAGIVRALLENTAAAYAERDPAKLDEALGRVVAQGPFPQVKAELSRAFAIPTRGGGLASVEAIAEVQVGEMDSISDKAGFSVMVSWIARATGRHWGHVDNKLLRIRALIDVSRFDGDWKLIGLTVVELKPVEAGLGA